MKPAQRPFLLLAVLALLGLGTWWLLHRSSRTDSTLDTEATAFSVADTASVDKIFVALRSGVTHTLVREARSYWTLDGKYTARPDQVRMLLNTLRRQRVKSPVPRAARNSVVRAMAGTGIKVEVYQKGERTNTFYVGGATNNRLGTYMILEGAEDPYIVHMPGFEGYLTTRFLLSPDDWHTLPVFTLPLLALERVEVVTPGQPDSSFAIARTARNTFGIADYPAADSLLLKSYLTQFARIFAQNLVDSASRPTVDSMMRRAPTHVVYVKERGKPRAERLRLWPIKNSKNGLIACTDRDSIPFIVQTAIFNNILVQRTEFVRKAQ